MKRISWIATLILCLLLWGCTRQQENGKTEALWVCTQVTEEFFVDGEPAGDERCWVYSYDACGRQTGQIWYENGEAISKTVSCCDEAGYLTETKTYDRIGPFWKCASRTELSYDDQGRNVETIFYDGWFEESRTIYLYDDEANTRTVINQKSGDETWIGTYTFDEAGKTLELRMPSPEEGVEHLTKYTYDENGNEITCEEYLQGVRTSWTECEYDEQNRRIQTTSYDRDGGITSAERYVYDDAENTRTWYKSSGGTRIEYYNERGDIIRIEDCDKDGTLVARYTYSYREIQVQVE